MSRDPIPIAYVAQSFPALTQTFVYREVLMLESKGFEIVTCAIRKPDINRISHESRHLVDRTNYVFPLSWLKFFEVHLYFLFSHPGKYISTLFYVLSRNGETPRNRLRSLFHFSEAVYLAPEIEKNDVKHIHAHFTINAATIALVLSRLLGISFSFTAHNIFFIDRILLEEKVKEALFIISISEFSKQFLLRLVPGWQDKIHIVHCGVSLVDFSPRAIPKNDTPSILFVAQLAERKGVPILVEACRIMVEREITFHCTIVGGGTEEEQTRIRQLINWFGLEKVIELAGAVPQEGLKDYLEQADVFVLPCVTATNGDMDGIPVSLMEAMAMEIPTVSTYVSGIPELIQNERSGLLVQENDPQALADALQTLLQDEYLRKRLGENGRLRVQAEFNIHKNIDQLATIFQGYLRTDE